MKFNAMLNQVTMCPMSSRYFWFTLLNLPYRLHRNSFITDSTLSLSSLLVMWKCSNTQFSLTNARFLVLSTQNTMAQARRVGRMREHVNSMSESSRMQKQSCLFSDYILANCIYYSKCQQAVTDLILKLSPTSTSLSIPKIIYKEYSPPQMAWQFLSLGVRTSSYFAAMNRAVIPRSWYLALVMGWDWQYLSTMSMARQRVWQLKQSWGCTSTSHPIRISLILTFIYLCRGMKLSKMQDSCSYLCVWSFISLMQGCTSGWRVYHEDERVALGVLALIFLVEGRRQRGMLVMLMPNTLAECLVCICLTWLLCMFQIQLQQQYTQPQYSRIHTISSTYLCINTPSFYNRKQRE